MEREKEEKKGEVKKRKRGAFPKKMRLRKKKDYQAVYQNRQQVRDSLLKIFYLPKEQNFSRMGMSVSRRIARGVKRNRIRRLIREAFRQNQSSLPLGYDFIIIPVFKQERMPSFWEWEKSLLTLGKKIQKKERKREENGRKEEG